ncbi:hypothetical protein [Streptomyces marokkonensis]|uniref:hypothetical protein n=1 Tax=Streptomyces marokkonensis TaxID=324855 RepID=UPI0011F2C6EA|nr:hypothetical protein [Streptomyces marokkonensis]
MLRHRRPHEPLRRPARRGGLGDCLAQPATGIAQLRSPEPDCFILDAKSYGRLNTFLLRTGYQQVDEIAAGYAATDPRTVRPGHGRTPRTSPARPA